MRNLHVLHPDKILRVLKFSYSQSTFYHEELWILVLLNFKVNFVLEIMNEYIDEVNFGVFLSLCFPGSYPASCWKAFLPILNLKWKIFDQNFVGTLGSIHMQTIISICLKKSITEVGVLRSYHHCILPKFPSRINFNFMYFEIISLVDKI